MRLHKNPNYLSEFADNKSGDADGDKLEAKIMDLYKEFNPTMYKYYSDQIEKFSREGELIGYNPDIGLGEDDEGKFARDEEGKGFERRGVLEGQLKERATSFVLNTMIPILSSYEGEMTNKGVSQKTVNLGAKLSALLDLLEKQEQFL